MWRPVQENDAYKISDQGELQLLSGKITIGSLDRGGYRKVILTIGAVRKQMLVHRLVAFAFIPNPSPGTKIFVNHINGNREDNRVVNLEWVTPKENSNAIVFPAKSNVRHSRSIIQYSFPEKEQIRIWGSALAAERELKVDRKYIRNCCQGKDAHAGGWFWQFKDEIGTQQPNEIWAHSELANCEVSSLGRIRTRFGQIVGGTELHGYYKYQGQFIHRLVATAFLPVPDPNDKKVIVNHKDGNGLNNSAINLEWVTNQENIQHAMNTGLRKANRPVEILMRSGSWRTFISIQEASRTYGVCASDIGLACQGTRTHAAGYTWRFSQSTPREIFEMRQRMLAASAQNAETAPDAEGGNTEAIPEVNVILDIEVASDVNFGLGETRMISEQLSMDVDSLLLALLGEESSTSSIVNEPTLIDIDSLLLELLDELE